MESIILGDIKAMQKHNDMSFPGGRPLQNDRFHLISFKGCTVMNKKKIMEKQVRI